MIWLKTAFKALKIAREIRRRRKAKGKPEHVEAFRAHKRRRDI